MPNTNKPSLSLMGGTGMCTSGLVSVSTGVVLTTPNKRFFFSFFYFLFFSLSFFPLFFLSLSFCDDFPPLFLFKCLTYYYFSFFSFFFFSLQRSRPTKSNCGLAFSSLLSPSGVAALCAFLTPRRTTKSFTDKPPSGEKQILSLEESMISNPCKQPYFPFSFQSQ